MKKLFTLIFATLTLISFLGATPVFDNDKDGGENKKVETTTNFDINANTLSENLNITFNTSASIESIKVINGNSEIILETGKSRGSAGSVINIPIEDMEPGTYFIRIQTDSGVQVQRIIIQ